MEFSSHRFKEKARAGLDNDALRQAMGNIDTGFQARRRAAMKRMPEFEKLQARAALIQDRALDDLDTHLESFAAQVEKRGGQVHWCSKPQDACDAVLAICRERGAKRVIKGKSMVSEEIGLNEYLTQNGISPVETDLGEYIIQIRDEAPSRIIAPALHLTEAQITESFRQTHVHLDKDRTLDSADDLLTEARTLLRRHFLEAGIGITGANFLIAETGTAVIVTNDGNGDLSRTLPIVHIIITSIEKIIPTLEEATTYLRLLVRSATGQEQSVYTSFVSGPKTDGELAGPGEFHVVLVDNGRSELIGGQFRDMVRCIKCGACLNHCPVYKSIGGHAYGWVYPGPMGAVLTPALKGLDGARALPFASTFCGRCDEVCPVQIPLTRLLRQWRERAFKDGLAGWKMRWGIKLWGFFARHPRLYRYEFNMKARLLAFLGRKRGVLRHVPFLTAWTRERDLPAPEGRTFMDYWNK